jgi:hypothetical protein
MDRNKQWFYMMQHISQRISIFIPIETGKGPVQNGGIKNAGIPKT